MTAAEFNTQFCVGSIFTHRFHSDLNYGREVRSVDVARDFKCGAVVEINVEPYFAKIEALIPVNRVS